MKRQIIFVEPKPTVYTYRIARTLKLTGKYETVLVSFSEVDKSFFGKAFDTFHVLEWSHKPNSKNFIDFFRKCFGKEGREFFNSLKKMRPYVFQITGTDLFSMITMFYLKKSPRIYFTYDLWGVDKRNYFFTKNPGIKGCFQKLFERICFKMADGVLHKTHSKEIKLLPYKLNIPILSFVPGCMDEWTNFSRKEKNKKEMHVGWAGNLLEKQDGRSSFLETIKIITSQNIHFHVFGPCIQKKEEKEFLIEKEKNKYFHIHKKTKPNELNKKLSKYDYGIYPVFYDKSVDLRILETEMPNKFFNYIEAGIPIIVNKQIKFMADMVEENKIGFSVNREDLKNLKKIISEQDYKKMRENMKKVQEKFRLSKRIKELEKFYEKVIKEKEAR